MPISPTNQAKNSIVGVGARKAGIYLWGDVIATWGDALATWGNVSIAPTNQEKSPQGSVTIYAGTPMGLLLSITYPTTFAIGGGVTNQSKS